MTGNGLHASEVVIAGLPGPIVGSVGPDQTVHFSLGEEGEVERALHVLEERARQAIARGSVLGNGGEIVDFVARCRTARLPEGRLHGGGVAGFKFLIPNTGRGRDHLIAHVHAGGNFGAEVTHVNVASIGNGPNGIHTLVGAPAEAKQVFLGPGDVFAEKGVTVHPFRWLDARQAQGGRREIDEAHQTIGVSARGVVSGSKMRVFFRNVDD